MAIKFLKTYRLEIDLADALATNGGGPISLTDPKSVVIGPPFTCEFSVERSTLADLNHADFTVYGLGETMRKQLAKDRWNTDIFRGIRFSAGYLPPPSNVKLAFERKIRPSLEQSQAEAAQLMTTVFQGNVVECWSERDSQPWATKIRAQSGNWAVQRSQTSRSYAAGTPYKKIMLDMIDDLQNVRLGAVGNFTGSIPRGQSYSASTLDALRELVEQQGGEVYIDNERIYCLKPGEFLTSNVPVISGETGIIGAPRMAQRMVTVKTLFEPGMLVGQAVELQSQNSKEINGVYQVKGLAHQGVISDGVGSSVQTRATISNYDVLIQEVPAI